MRKRRTCLSVLAILAGSLQAVLAQLPVDTLSIRAHTYFLTHDLLEGRATGTLGAELAAEYIASECRGIGLLPAGSTYTQPVPLEEATFGPGTQFTLIHPDGETQFTYGVDFIPNVGSRETLTGFRGPAVFVGDPTELDDANLAGVELQGVVAVVLGPQIERDRVDWLKGRGVVGVVHVVADERTYSMYVAGRGSSRMYFQDPLIESSYFYSLPSVLVGPRLSASLLIGAFDGDQIRVGAVGADIEYDLPLERETLRADNVVCLLHGTDPTVSDTAIVFTAHYDHLGVVSPPDSTGDDIYNGFADNAVGVAMLLGIARSMALDVDDPPKHSMLFLFLVGEERGLLGSDYYVAHPYWPLERTRAVINLDAGAPPGLLVSWSLSGVDSTGLGRIALDIAEARGWSVSLSPAAANSDYYPFVRRGIPGVFVKPGPGAYEGLSADSSDALRYRWRYYHDPRDEWTADFPFSGLQRYAEYAYMIARELDTVADIH